MAAQSTINKHANALITLFISKYEEKHKRAPQINRYKQKWGFQDMVTDIGYEKSKEVIEHYFGLRKADHPVQTLLYNYDQYARVIEEKAKDRAERHALRAETKKVVEGMRNIGNDSSERS